LKIVRIWDKIGKTINKAGQKRENVIINFTKKIEEIVVVPNPALKKLNLSFKYLFL
jgi:hypothetical protein